MVPFSQGSGAATSQPSDGIHPALQLQARATAENKTVIWHHVWCNPNLYTVRGAEQPLSFLLGSTAAAEEHISCNPIVRSLPSFGILCSQLKAGLLLAGFESACTQLKNKIRICFRRHKWICHALLNLSNTSMVTAA